MSWADLSGTMLFTCRSPMSSAPAVVAVLALLFSLRSTLPAAINILAKAGRLSCTPLCCAACVWLALSLRWLHGESSRPVRSAKMGRALPCCGSSMPQALLADRDCSSAPLAAWPVGEPIGIVKCFCDGAQLASLLDCTRPAAVHSFELQVASCTLLGCNRCGLQAQFCSWQPMPPAVEQSVESLLCG